MEIEIPGRLLRWTLVVVIVLGLATLGLLGWVNTPHDDEGLPLILNPERRAILNYLNDVEGWVSQFEAAGKQLDGLMPPGSSTDTSGAEPASGAVLPTAPPPAMQPEDLYQRSHEAQQAREALETLARDVDLVRVPDPLIGLHGIVIRTVETHLIWADGVLAYVGAPDSVDHGDLALARTDALAILEDLKETLP